MDEIFAKKAWCAPVALASSSGASEKRESNSADGCSKGKLLNGQLFDRYLYHAIIFVDSPKLKVTSPASLLSKRMAQREEHETAKAKRHREKMEMDEKFLAVLEKLANK